jgi:nitrite reductase/ring-hydroxylating ferredoxin subunit/uncharacterized membrane protein
MNTEKLAEQLQGTITEAFESAGDAGVRLKDVLHGTWLGHAFHPLLVTVPIGTWTAATVMDLVGAKRGADTAIGFGILAALPTAATGLTDWLYTEGKPRRVGLAHAAFNSAALTCYTMSWLARRSGHRGLGVLFSTVGLGLVGAGGYLGGELSYTLGQGVNRNAWSPEVEQLEEPSDEFVTVMSADDLREGRPAAAEVTLSDVQVPLVLVRKGREVFALNGRCSHLGGPLTEGKLVDEWCLECPWHASRFDIRDGSVDQGPAVYPQSRFEARVKDGTIQVRPMPEQPSASPSDAVDRLLASVSDGSDEQN